MYYGYHCYYITVTVVTWQMEEWTEISRICKASAICLYFLFYFFITKVRKHFIVMDVVYQGFASGDLEKDVTGVRKLVEDGHKLGICQSFSKNMGLYGKQ